MFLFGHIGISLGVGILTNCLIKISEKKAATTAVMPVGQTKEQSAKKKQLEIAKGLDLRFLIIGAILPDIFDKPLGVFIFGNIISNGRIFFHTLLFLVFLAAAGIWVWRCRRSTWLLSMAAGVFLHLIFDQIWIEPVTLYWPFLGWAFVRHDVENWVGNVLYVLFNEPTVYMPELIGLIITVAFVIVVLLKGKILNFVLKGEY